MVSFNPNYVINELLKFGSNPQQVEQMLMMRNPNLKILANQIKQSGLNPIDFAVQYANQHNIPVNKDILTNNYNQMLNLVKHRY